ncbi:MAG TPA: TolC family protein, partial [Opitutaceae bacterium]|nr:TolC family protein [Opitutaceae bacterium]
LWVTSCARYHPQPLAPEQSAQAFEERRLDAPAVRAFLERNLTNASASWPPATWTFEPLTLAALYLHPSLEVARADWAVARGGEVTASGRPNPTLSAAPEYNFNPAHGVSPWIASVQFDVPIETAGKRRWRMEHAAQLSIASQRKISVAAWTVRRNVRSALLALSAARERERVLAAQLQIRARAAASVEAKFAAGAFSSTDVEAERALGAELQRDRALARAQAAEAHARLASAVGVTLAGLPPTEQIDATLPHDSTLTSATARRRALTARADFLATLADYAAAEKALKLEIAKQYPDLHLNPGYQWDQGENKWALGVSIDLPVLNQNQGPIAEAKARRAAAAARVHELQATIIGELERALTSFRYAQATVEAARASMAAHEKRLQSARAALESGAIEVSDVLLAETQRVGSELQLVEAQAQLRQAVADIEDAVQFPLPEIENEPNPK